MSELKKLSLRQRRTIQALLVEKSIEGAAESAGVGTSSVRRWMASDGQFREALDAAKREITAQAFGRLQAAAGLAVDGLVDVLKNPQALPHTKVAAARCMLDLVLKTTEIQSIESRLAALECQITGSL